MAARPADARPLVIVVHPDLANSRVNARLATELQARPDEFVVHDLYAFYHDDDIDVEAEQELLAAHELVVYQFPVWWYTCPPLLHHWMNEVFTEGWAYGGARSQPGEPGRMLAGKRFACAVAAGDLEENYHPGRPVGATMAQVLDADFAVFGTEVDLTDERLDRVATDYLVWLRHFA